MSDEDTAPTGAFYVFEELGYAECRVDMKIGFFTGFKTLSLAVSSFVLLVALRWWWPIPSEYGWLAPFALKLGIVTTGMLGYLHWLNPLLYESVAAKRGFGLELCSRWLQFEDAVVLPFRDMVAVTLQELTPEQLVLVIKMRDDSSYVGFTHSEPNFMFNIQVYSSIACTLPRGLCKGRVVALNRNASKPWSLSKWASKEASFLAAARRHGGRRLAALQQTSFTWCHRHLTQTELGRRALRALRPATPLLCSVCGRVVEFAATLGGVLTGLMLMAGQQVDSMWLHARQCWREYIDGHVQYHEQQEGGGSWGRYSPDARHEAEAEGEYGGGGGGGSGRRASGSGGGGGRRQKGRHKGRRR